MIVDSVVLAVLLISALISLLRGLIRETLTIAGVIGGGAAAYFGGPLLSPFMYGWIGADKTSTTDMAESGEAIAKTAEGAAKAAEEPRLFNILPYDVVADALSYGLICILVVGILSVLSHFLAEGAKSVGLGPIDRTLGFIFGIARGVFVLGLLYLPVHFFIDQDSKDTWFKDSRTHLYIEQTSIFFAGFIPQSAVEDAEKTADAVSEADQTRRKLEQINLLKTRTGGSPPPQDTMRAPSNTPPSQLTPADSGYSEDFRDTMDKMFEEKTIAPSAPTGKTP